MDFQRLTRRELQVICKKNKIPANMTNVAMIESLKALEIVEGIEEFLPICESETAQSSIDSPARSEVTSPCVPPTGGRTTRRRNAAKEEPQTAKPSIRTQRTTRKTRVKDAGEPQAEAIETPAMVPQTNRRKGRIASACRKMDSQLEECVEEEKKDVGTPAQSGVTTRRRRGAKEETEVKPVYGTRRSVRLSEKNVELLNEVGNEDPDFSKKELFANDCEESKMNEKESTEDLDEKSGITGAFDADIVVEENSEKKDEAEVVSAEKQELISSVNEVEEEMMNISEADGAKSKLKENCDKTEAPNDENKARENVDVEIEEKGFGSEIEADLEKEEWVETGAPNEDIKAQDNDGSGDVPTSEIEIKIEVEKIEQNTDEDADNDDQNGNYGANAGLESGDNFGIAEDSCDIGDHNEIQKEISDDNILGFEDVTDLNVNVEKLEINGSHDVQPSEIDIEVQKTEEHNTAKDAGYEVQVANCEENVALEGEEHKDAGCDDEVASCGENSVLESEDNIAIGEVSCDTDIHSEIEKDESNDNDLDYLNVKEEEVLEINVDDVHEDSSSENEFKPNELDSLDLEAATEDDSLPFDISLMNEEDEASKWDAVFAYVNEKDGAIEAKDEMNTVKDTELQLQQPIARKKMSTAVSDNKENIGSGGELVLTKDRVKIAKKNSAKNANIIYSDMSMGKLRKLLKELHITNKPSKNENDVEVPARPALQALPENREAN